MPEKIKICHFSGKRGGFGALSRTLKMIKDDPDLELQIIVSDMHMMAQFGETHHEVSGLFDINAFVDMEQNGDRAEQRSVALGNALKKIPFELERLKPDALLVLGDRGEVLSAVIAAVNLKIPVLHIEGGDITGGLDEFFRHAITKMAHIHFPATEQYAQRLRKMGEEDWRIFTAGDAHIDPIANNEYLVPEEVCGEYEVEAGKYLVILQHSVSTEPEKSKEQMEAVLEAVNKSGLQAIIIYPCSDQGHQGVIDAIRKNEHNPKFKIHRNIKAGDFMGLLAGACAVVGNSSCGIKEAPYLGVPTINIGNRQEGRPKDKTIIDVQEAKSEKILNAIELALKDKEFRKNLGQCQKLYGEGRTAETILKTIKEIKFDDRLFNKRMTY